MKVTYKYTGSVAAFAALAFLMLLPISCRKMDQQENDPAKMRKVLLLYADGYNNLPGYMADDVSDLSEVSPKEYLRDRYTILAFQHFATYNAQKGKWDYTLPTSPLLLELRKDGDGNVITDTVKVYPDTMVTSSIQGLRTVLSDVKEMYPASEYGLVYSSHGTGWVPVEYYNSDDEVISVTSVGGQHITGRIDLLYTPLFKSLGCQAYYQGTTLRTKEMDVRGLADAFPMHMKYIIFDACLMGGVETAYQLRDITDRIIFVSTEVPGGGFDYKNLPDRVLYPSTPDYKAVLDDYKKLNDGAISLVDCSGLEALAAACDSLFAQYSTQIASLKAGSVQTFGRYHDGKYHPWYFDLRDILLQAGASLADLSELEEALAGCIEYKLNTDKFYSVDIETYCGLSMYLPSAGDAQLDTYYKGYDWNDATSLVK